MSGYVTVFCNLVVAENSEMRKKFGDLRAALHGWADHFDFKEVVVDHKPTKEELNDFEKTPQRRRFLYRAEPTDAQLGALNDLLNDLKEGGIITKFQVHKKIRHKYLEI